MWYTKNELFVGAFGLAQEAAAETVPETETFFVTIPPPVTVT